MNIRSPNIKKPHLKCDYFSLLQTLLQGVTSCPSSGHIKQRNIMTKVVEKKRDGKKNEVFSCLMSVNTIKSPMKSHVGLILLWFCCTTMLLATVCMVKVAKASELTVYSSRAKHLILPFFKEYERQTGVKIHYLNGKSATLRQRLLLEGDKTPADIFFTVDAGNLWKADTEGLLSKSESKILQHNIPEHLRDESGRWFALTIRARTFVYSPRLIQAKELTNYRDLAKQKWRNSLCVRTSKKVYNQSLVAMLIHHYGVDITEKTVKGWVANFAHKPYAKDTHVIQAVARGTCAVGLVNTYYYGRQVKKDPNFANKVKLSWAGQGANDFGTHINVSGAGVVKHSDNKEQALHLLEWLSSQQVQEKFAAINLEYPVNKRAKIDPIMEKWGKFQEDTTPLYIAGRNQVEAIKLMDRVGYK